MLAAGLGERLKPLTYTRPKALVPVANKPVIVRLLELTSSYGIGETIINLHSYPEDIKNLLGNGNWWNTHIYYSYEPELLGTAGAIKKAEKFLEGDKFILINADIVTDIDIGKAIEFHESNNARATLILKEPHLDSDYEKIGVSSDGRILKDKIPGDEIKVGVYTGIGVFESSVIEMIPEGNSSLLESVLIPLAKEGSIYAYFTDRYWMDIGVIERYIQANKDLLSGKAHIPIDGKLISDNLWIDISAQIDLSVEIEEPALIGKGASIEKGAKIGPYAVIGKHCNIGPGVEISHSVLWDKCNVGARSSINNSVITESQTISPGQRVNRAIINSGVTEPIFDI